MRNCFVIIVWLLASEWAVAQLTALDSAYLSRRIKPTVAIKLLPSAAFDVNATYQLAVEVFSKDGKHSIQPELGFGTYESTPRMFESPSYKGQSVWRGRLEWRTYTEKVVRYNHENSYMGVDVFFKHVSTPRDAEVGRQCDAGNCAFFEQIKFNEYKTVGGVNFKYGFQWIGAKGFVIDFYGGAGLRLIRIWRRGFPNDTNPTDGLRGGLFSRSVGTYYGPSVLLGVRVGYLFGQAKHL
jgi:hypothetical protein